MGEVWVGCNTVVCNMQSCRKLAGGGGAAGAVGCPLTVPATSECVPVSDCSGPRPPTTTLKILYISGGVNSPLIICTESSDHHPTISPPSDLDSARGTQRRFYYRHVLVDM